SSSRVFVHNLPPNITVDGFRTHFSSQNGRKVTITDAKVLPHRRIGFIGYKTPEDAASAVKYFNKTFIRTTRIAVELARTVGDGNLEHVKEVRLKRKREDREAAAASNGPVKKHKHELEEKIQQDPKLKEYLEVMSNRKGKAWENGMAAGEGQDTAEVEVPVVEDNGLDDGEYQTLPLPPRIPEPPKSTPLPPEPPQIPEKVLVPDSEQPSPTQDDDDLGPPPVEAGPVSDLDWLRSRTNRVLDFADDEEKVDPVRKDSPQESNDHAAPVPAPETAEVPEDHEMEEEQYADDNVDDPNVESIRKSGRLFIRNLSYATMDEDLEQLFQQFNHCQEVHVPVDNNTGSSKGLGYAQFSNPESAVEAYQTLDRTIFQGRILHILPAAPRKDTKLDEFEISKLPIKKQKQIQRKSQAASQTFNWNSLYMNVDAVMDSTAARLGVTKGELLDPTSSDAAVKQALAETHVIQDTKKYFADNGVDLEAFKSKAKGQTGILVKNFDYGTKGDTLRKMLEEFGTVTRFLMPPSGTIAIAEFERPDQAKNAFAALAYRKVGNSLLFLERAPKELFAKQGSTALVSKAGLPDAGTQQKVSTTDLLEPDDAKLVDTSTLFVGNLDFSTTSEGLAEVFRPLDGFLSAKVKMKQNTKRPEVPLSMGFGFLEFRTKAQAQAAQAAMDAYKLDGHNLVIKASHRGVDAAEERRKEDAAKKAANNKTKIIVKNLPFEASKKDIRTLFATYGQLRSVRVPKKFDNTSRGFAFAEFTTPREATSAMEALRNTHLLGRRLVLDFATQELDDPEAELERMQKKVGEQASKVALRKLTSAGRSKFTVGGGEEEDD
ncbi:pre-rRNA processing protein, partial [Eremomyces bilateralis CBS 781.70]